jgi:hypothetical protein
MRQRIAAPSSALSKESIAHLRTTANRYKRNAASQFQYSTQVEKPSPQSSLSWDRIGERLVEITAGNNSLLMIASNANPFAPCRAAHCHVP